MISTERYSDFEETIRSAFEGFQRGVWTALPGIIDSFDATKGTAVVKSAVKGIRLQPDGSFLPEDILMPDVPIVAPRGGNCVLTFPVVKGDECLLVVSSRCIDSWWDTGAAAIAFEPTRMHDLSDCFALVGPFSRPKVPANWNTSAAQLRSIDGSTYVELDPAGRGVKIVAPSGVTITAPSVDCSANVRVGSGATGSFSTPGGQLVTVLNGIVTEIS